MTIGRRMTALLVVTCSTVLSVAGCEAEDADEMDAAVEGQREGGSDGSRDVGSDAGPDGEDNSREEGGTDAVDAGADGSTDTDDGAIAVVTRVADPDGRSFYIHMLEEFPEDGELDYAEARELGEMFTSVHDGHLYVSDRESFAITKYAVEDDLSLDEQETVSLQQLGVSFVGVFWASTGQPYVVDPNSGLVVRFDPDTMELIDDTAIPEDVLVKDGVTGWPWNWNAAESDGRAFFTWSWIDYEALTYYPRVALASFPLDGAPEFGNLVEDDRCQISDSVIPWTDDEGRVYAVGLGSFFLGDVGDRTRDVTCVLRMEPGASEFDPNYYVDLTEVIDTPDVYAVWRMTKGNKLLVNHLMKGAPLPEDKQPYWEAGSEDYVLSIVDLDDMGVTAVDDIPAGGVMSHFDLKLDGDKYVQVYEGDDAVLYRVEPDGSAERVLNAGTNGDFQLIARVR